MPDGFIKNHHGINIKYPVSDKGRNAKKINSYLNSLNKAKEEIKKKIIAADKSKDNTVRYVAITNFKKTNE